MEPMRTFCSGVLIAWCGQTFGGGLHHMYSLREGQVQIVNNSGVARIVWSLGQVIRVATSKGMMNLKNHGHLWEVLLCGIII